MLGLKNLPALKRAAFVVVLAGVTTGQNATPSAQNAPAASQSKPAPPKALSFDEFLDATIRQERSLANLMRNFKPIVETYVQEEKPDPKTGSAPKNDQYFLSRLDMTGSVETTRSFKEEERKKPTKNVEGFSASGFALALFPDLDHLDRQNYNFEFVRFENLGDVRCAVINVFPRENADNRGFMGRIWVEDQDHAIVRFVGSYTAKGFNKRAFHFDSWRLNTLDIRWMPAYVYTEESDPRDPSRHGLLFKAQTRIWGYDLTNAGDHREFAKRLTDTPGWVDPKRHEASQNLNPELTLGKATYTPEDEMVERLQVAGLMAPDGEVDKVLETVANNLLITNNLDLAAVRCRVLLTTPLESFVVGRTIVMSRGLLDVLPDEATLAAVLAHEVAHVVLQHSLGAEYLSGTALPFSDLDIFSHLNFQFTLAQEAEADKKGLELFSKSPYRDQLVNAGLFLQALETRSPQLPNLLHGRFSNDFGGSHLVGMPGVANSGKGLQMDRLDQFPALPLGSRIGVDPWSDRITMLKSKPVRPESAAEKMPFEVTPFFPYLKRLELENGPEAAKK
jgi:Peptidase family M48